MGTGAPGGVNLEEPLQLENLASIRVSSAVEVMSAVVPQSFNPTAMGRLDGRPVVRLQEQLQLHPALRALGWTGDDSAEAARMKNESMLDPIAITTNGTILAGFGHWKSAIFDGRLELNCIEHPLSEDESLQFILAIIKPARGWNRFVRICLALTLEPNFQQRALDNMRIGANARVVQICRKLRELMCAKKSPESRELVPVLSPPIQSSQARLV